MSKDYVKQMYAHGFRDEHVQDRLRKAGWKDHQIKALLEEVAFDKALDDVSLEMLPHTKYDGFEASPLMLTKMTLTTFKDNTSLMLRLWAIGCVTTIAGTVAALFLMSKLLESLLVLTIFGLSLASTSDILKFVFGSAFILAFTVGLTSAITRGLFMKGMLIVTAGNKITLKQFISDVGSTTKRSLISMSILYLQLIIGTALIVIIPNAITDNGAVITLANLAAIIFVVVVLLFNVFLLPISVDMNKERIITTLQLARKLLFNPQNILIPVMGAQGVALLLIAASAMAVNVFNGDVMIVDSTGWSLWGGIVAAVSLSTVMMIIDTSSVHQYLGAKWKYENNKSTDRAIITNLSLLLVGATIFLLISAAV